jgi:hypothetical protein
MDDSVLSELSLDISTLDCRSETEFRREDARVSVLLLRLINTVSSSSSARRPDTLSELVVRALDRILAISSSTSHPSPRTSHPPATPIPSTSLTALLPSLGIPHPTVTRRVGLGDSSTDAGDVGGDRKM